LRKKQEYLPFRGVPSAEESLLGTPISRLAGFVKNANREIGDPRRKEREILRQLKLAGVSEDSDVWKKAWEIYRDSLRRK
jgi:hypothetical protein